MDQELFLHSPIGFQHPFAGPWWNPFVLRCPPNQHLHTPLQVGFTFPPSVVRRAWSGHTPHCFWAIWNPIRPSNFFDMPSGVSLWVGPSVSWFLLVTSAPGSSTEHSAGDLQHLPVPRHPWSHVNDFVTSICLLTISTLFLPLWIDSTRQYIWSRYPPPLLRNGQSHSF